MRTHKGIDERGLPRRWDALHQKKMRASMTSWLHCLNRGETLKPFRCLPHYTLPAPCTRLTLFAALYVLDDLLSFGAVEQFTHRIRVPGMSGRFVNEVDQHPSQISIGPVPARLS